MKERIAKKRTERPLGPEEPVQVQSPGDPLGRMILVVISSREPVSAIEFEDLAPRAAYKPNDVKVCIDELEDKGLISKLPALVPTNGTTLYVPTERGRETARTVIEEEASKNYPSARYIYAASFLDAFPALGKKFSIVEIQRCIESNPDQFVQTLRKQALVQR